MAIVNDQENERVVDTETGDYMTWKTEDRENYALYFILHDLNGKGILGTVVQIIAKDETNLGGAATHVKYSLLKTWIPSGKPERPTYFYGPHDRISQLEEFLYVRRHYGGVKNPDPTFEFADARNEQGDCT
jgi:hypothetical protein